MREFYIEDHLIYNDDTASRSVKELLADKSLGAIFLLRDSVNQTLGYAVATLGFSLEFGGRFVLLDELYLHPTTRGLGAGKSALAYIESWAATQGIGHVRLEVNHHNKMAYALYLQSGFHDDHRYILSKSLT